MSLVKQSNCTISMTLRSAMQSALGQCLRYLRTPKTSCTSSSEDGMSGVCHDFEFARECRLTEDARNATLRGLLAMD